MSTLLTPLRWVYCIYALLTFIILMFCIIPFVAAASLFGKIKGGNVIYLAVRWWGYCWYFLIGIRHKNLYEVAHDSSRQYIFVANHSSYMDIPPIFMALHQPVRILAKFEMASIPVFGFIYRSATIMVDRRDATKRAESIREMKNFIRNHISIFIFPEGTFNESADPLKPFFDGAFRIAIETETPVKPVLFLDNIKRLHYSSVFTLTPGPCRVVFLEEIPVKGLTINDLPSLKEQVHTQMEAGLRRYRES